MRRGTTAALLAALLLAGCTSDGGEGTPPEPPPSTDGVGAPRPEGARLEQVRRAAARAVEVVLSHDHRTLAADEAAATALMTPEYAEEFRTSFARLRSQAARVQGSSRAVALDSGVVSATADTVRVLVFVDRTTRSGEVQQSVARVAPVVSMELSGDAWRVSDIATGTTPGGDAPAGVEAAAVRHATRTARAYLTLSWETIQADLAEVQGLIAGQLAGQYADGADALVEAVRARRTVQRPRILAVGLSGAHDGQVDALVSALVTTTHQATGDGPSREGRRLRLRLERDGTGWRTTQLAVVD